MRFTVRSVAVLVLGLALGAAGCSSGDDEGGADDAPLTVDGVLAASAAAMADVETAAFVLEQEGAAVPIDESGQLLFRAADGRVARPASAEAVVTVDALGFTTEVGAIAIDGDIWFTNPLSGEWLEAPDSFTFDPAALFDPEDGFAGILAEVVPNAELLGTVDEATEDGGPEGDGPWHRVEATVSAERVEVLTGGLLAAETTIDAWIDTDTDRLSLVRFELPIGDEISAWRMVITDYDFEIDIAPPEL